MLRKSLKPNLLYDYNRSIQQFILWLRKHVKLYTIEARYLQLFKKKKFTMISFKGDSIYVVKYNVWMLI